MRLGQIIRYWGDGVGTRNAQNKAIKVNIYEFEGMTVVSTTSKEHSKCLKSPTRLLNRVCVGRRGLDLSKEVLWVSVCQRAAKLPAGKVGGLKKNSAMRPGSRPTHPCWAAWQNYFSNL